MKTYNNSVVLRNDGTDPSSLKDDLNAGISKLVTVRVASLPTPGLGALASLFDINSVAIANPVTTDNNGNYVFKVGDGDYDIIIEEGTLNVVINPSVEIIEIPSSANLINNLSQAYAFKTVAEYQSFVTPFPIGKDIVTDEFATGSGGGATYKIVTGGGDTFGVLANNTTSQSARNDKNNLL